MRLMPGKLFLMNKMFSFEDKTCNNKNPLDTQMRIKVFYLFRNFAVTEDFRFVYH